MNEVGQIGRLGSKEVSHAMTALTSDWITRGDSAYDGVTAGGLYCGACDGGPGTHRPAAHVATLICSRCGELVYAENAFGQAGCLDCI